MATKGVQLKLYEMRINLLEADPSGCTLVKI